MCTPVLQAILAALACRQGQISNSGLFQVKAVLSSCSGAILASTDSKERARLCSHLAQSYGSKVQVQSGGSPQCSSAAQQPVGS